jgi:hypothetical protein
MIMSEDVHYRGKLLPTNKTAIEFIGRVAVPDNCEDAEEYFNDLYYKKAVLIRGKVFTVKKDEIDSDGDIFYSKKNDDGSIDFEVKYYNGGCSFDEAIETALK